MAAPTSPTGFERLHTVELNDVELAYREVGDGAPVVFVHGGLSDLRTWSAQLTGLSDSYRCIAYSRRFARPNRDIEPGVDDQMIQHCDDLADFLSAVAATPAHLVGNSWGASVCLLSAIRRPTAVLSLVLEEPPVVPLTIGPGNRPHLRPVLANLLRRPHRTAAVMQFGLRTMAPVQRAFRRGDDEATMATFLDGVLGKVAAQNVTDTRRAQMRDNASSLKAQMLGAGFPPLTPAEVRSLRAPTLLLSGQRSPNALHAMSDGLAELLPDVERAEIPNASHLMHEDQPDAVNTAIRSFLARHDLTHNH